MRVIGGLLAALSGVVLAQEADTGWYAGFGLGGITREETIPADLMLGETTSAVKFFGGFKWSSRWGVEVSYIDQASVETPTASYDLLVDDFSSVFSTQIAALTIRPMAYLPVAWGTLFGGVGLFEGDTRRELNVGAPVPLGMLPTRFSESASGATLLLGTEWPLGALRLRAEYEWWDLDRADNSSLGLGLSYRF